MKKETLEEVIFKKYPRSISEKDSELRNAFIEGAKWQQERSYSEEDIKTVFFSAIKVTGEGWNGEYANGNNPNVESIFNSDYIECLKQFKN